MGAANSAGSTTPCDELLGLAPPGARCKQRRALVPAHWKTPARPRRVARSGNGSAPRQQPSSVGATCASDNHCGRGTFCKLAAQRCVKVRRHINILYLFYLSRDRRFAEALGLFWQYKKGQRGYRVIFPFYWHKWGKKRHTRVVFPLYWDVRRGDRRTVVLPPFHYRKTAKATTFNIWPLMFYERRAKRGTRFTLVPLLHYAREHDKTLTILPPLLSFYSQSERQKYSSGLLGGLFYWRRKQTERSWALIPLIFRRSDTRWRKSLTWIAPFNFYWRNADRSWLGILPLFSHYRRPKRSTTLALVPPLYVHSSPNKKRVYLPPLFFYHRNDQRRTTIVGPVYHYSRPGAGAFGVAPLLFTSWSRSPTGSERRSVLLLPILWHEKGPQRNTWIVGPMMFHRRGDKRLLGLAPLYFDWRTSTRRTIVVPPLFVYAARKRGRRKTFVSPLFYYSHDKDRARRQWALIPFYYQRRDPRRSIDIALPLFARFADHQRGTRTLIAGPLLLQRGPDSDSQVFFPLFWRFRKGDETSLLILPLFYRQKNNHSALTFAGPYYRHRTRDGHHTGLWPLVFVGRHGRAERARSYQVVFPLFWRFTRPGHNVTLAGPVYYQRSPRGTRLAVAPLFYRSKQGNERTTVVFPFIWRYANEKGSHTVLFPLGYYGQDADGQGHVALGGPGYYVRHKNGYYAGLVPLFFFGRNGDSSHQVVFPFFWRFASAAGSTTVAGPFFHRRTPTGHHTGLVPLVFIGREKERRYRVVFPLFWRFTRPGRSFTLVGPVFHRRRESGYETGVAPLVYIGRRGKKRHQIIFPIFWRFTRPGHSFTLAGPVYHRRTPRGHATGVVPLVFVGRDGEKSYQVVFPFFWRFNKGNGHTTVLGPAFWARGETSSSHGVLPLWVATREGKRRTLTIPPLLFHRSTDPENGRSSTWALLYSGSRAPERIRRSLWPLFHYERRRLSPDSAATRTTVGLLPFFHYRKDPAETRLLTPLGGFIRRRERLLAAFGPIYYTQSKDRRGFGVLPLLFASWDRGQASRQHRVSLFPVFDYQRRPGRTSLFTLAFGFSKSKRSTLWYLGPYINYRRGDTALDVLLPLGFRYTNKRRRSTTVFVLPGYYGSWGPGRSRHVLFPLLWHRSSRYSGGHTVVFPLLWSYHGNRRHSRVFFPLYWDFRRGDKRTVVALNVLYVRNKRKGTYDFHFLPLFRIQRKRPQDIKWSILGGLFGYERIGRNRYLRIFLIPIELSPVDPEPRRATRRRRKALGAAVGPAREI